MKINSRRLVEFLQNWLDLLSYSVNFGHAAGIDIASFGRSQIFITYEK